MAKVFVYGTLKRGQPNHYLMNDDANGHAEFIGEGTTFRKYPLVIASRCHIPCMLPVEGTGENIKGEIYEVDDKMLKCLDICEDCPALYDRRLIDVKTENGSNVECLCYFLVKHKQELELLPFIKDYRSEGSHGQPYNPELDEEYDDYSDIQEQEHKS